MKNLLFLLLMAFVACDFGYPLKMNEQDSFVVKSDGRKSKCRKA